MPTEFTITKTPAFRLPDGNSYATIEIAQRAALLKLLTSEQGEKTGVGEQMANGVLQIIFERLDAVKQILKCTGRKPRKAKGNGRPRTRRNAAEKGEVAK